MMMMFPMIVDHHRHQEIHVKRLNQTASAPLVFASSPAVMTEHFEPGAQQLLIIRRTRDSHGAFRVMNAPVHVA